MKKYTIQRWIGSVGCAVCLIAPSLQAAPKAPAKTAAKASGKNAGKGAGRQGVMRQVIKRLGLTATQQTKIGALWKNSQVAMKALNANKTLTIEQKRARRQVIHADRMAQIRQLLTTSQRQKLDVMIAEQKSKRKKP